MRPDSLTRSPPKPIFNCALQTVGATTLTPHSSRTPPTCPTRRKAVHRQPSLPLHPKAKANAHPLPRKASATIATTTTITASKSLTLTAPYPILSPQVHTRSTGGPANKARALPMARTFNTAITRTARRSARRHDLHLWVGLCCLALRRKSEHTHNQPSSHHRRLQPCLCPNSLVPDRYQT